MPSRQQFYQYVSVTVWREKYWIECNKAKGETTNLQSPGTYRYVLFMVRKLSVKILMSVPLTFLSHLHMEFFTIRKVPRCQSHWAKGVLSVADIFLNQFLLSIVAL